MTRALLVLGMHRSGTSALAGCIERLGVTLGDRLLPGTAGDNERGFFEHADIVAAHERFLAAHGRAWDDPRPSLREPLSPEEVEALGADLQPILERDFQGTDLWAVKDPRLCRLAPAWLPLLERRRSPAAALIVCRPPAEVAASLARRNGFSPAKSVLLWLDHVLAAERATRSVPRAFVDFEGLLADPTAVLAAAGERLGMAWPRPPASRRPELAAFLSADLRHHRGDQAALAGVALADLAATVDAVQREAAAGRENPVAFDQLAEEFLRRAPAFEPVLLEHLHQAAARSAADRAWQVQRELDPALAELRRTLDEELGRHGPELRRLGESLQGLGESLQHTRRELGDLAAEATAQGETLTSERRERAAADASLEDSLRSTGQSVAELEAGLAGLGEAQRALDWLAGRLDALEHPPRGLAARLAAALRVLRGRPPGSAS